MQNYEICGLDFLLECINQYSEIFIKLLVIIMECVCLSNGKCYFDQFILERMECIPTSKKADEDELTNMVDSDS